MIPIPTLYIIVLLICTNGISAIMWYVKSNDAKTYKAQVVSCQEERKFFGEQVRAQGELAARKLLAEQIRTEQVTKEVSHEYETRLSTLRSDYQRLRQQANRGSGSSPMPAISFGPRSLDEISPNALPVAEQCAETTLMLVELQDWIRQVQ